MTNTRPKEWLKEFLENSPSRKDGLSKSQEALWRRRYCRLAERTAKALHVGFIPRQSAVIYLHQYFAVRSMARNDPLILVTAALYLACKVEEQPKSLTKVCQAVYSEAYRRHPKALGLVMKQEVFLQLKQKVITAERSLLYVLGFTLEVQQPPQIAVKYLQQEYNRFLPDGQKISQEQWDQECKQQEGAAFTLLNQISNVLWTLGVLSYQVDNYLHYKSSHVAAACIYVAQQTMQLTIPPENGWEWWEMMPFQIPLETLTELTAKLLDLLQLKQGTRNTDGQTSLEATQPRSVQ